MCDSERASKPVRNPLENTLASLVSRLGLVSGFEAGLHLTSRAIAKVKIWVD